MSHILFCLALAAGSVPLYTGAPNIKQYLPSNRSAIFADDFKYEIIQTSPLYIFYRYYTWFNNCYFRSPEDLAKYLKNLVANETAYNEYLEWKYKGPDQSFLKLLQVQKWDARCRLCMKIRNIWNGL